MLYQISKNQKLLNYFKTTDINIAFFIEPSKKQIDAFRFKY